MPSAAVGILPVGALGAAFFFHLTRGLQVMDGSIRFIERRGSTSGAALRERGTLVMAGEDGPRALAASGICQPDLLASFEAGWVPEFLLVCTQSDQLLPVVTDFVRLLERLHAAHGLDVAVGRLPLLLLCSNGIYHERVRRFLVELLEDSMLYGRLPDLWSGAMGQIVGKLLRGVTIQTGYREASGGTTIYRPGPPGRTTVAGGDPIHRRRCAALLHERGALFEAAETAPPVRVEFDKALVNLCGNLLGQLKAIDASGVFRPLKVREIFPEPEGPETRELAHHVVAIGRAVRAYRDDEDFETIYRAAMAMARGPLDHVPSSLRWIETHLRAGTLSPRITPTERWLLDPLVRYASTAGLEASAHYFTALIQKVEERLALAVKNCPR